MFDRLIGSIVGAPAATVAPYTGAVLVSPTVAWTAIVAVLGVAAIALWFLQDTHAVNEPQKPTSYREAA